MASLFDPFLIGATILELIPGVKRADPVRFIVHLPVNPGPNALRSVFQQGHNIWKWSHHLPNTVPRAEQTVKKEQLKLPMVFQRSSQEIAASEDELAKEAVELPPIEEGSRKSDEEKAPAAAELLDEDGLPFFHAVDDDDDLEAKIAAFTNEQHAYWTACEKFHIPASTTVLRQIHNFEVVIKGVSFNDLEFKALTTSLVTNYTVRRLELYRCHLTDQQITYLTDYLVENNTVSDLILAYTKLDFRPLRRLFEELSAKDNLVYLDMSGNQFRDKDIPYFADYFQNSSSLCYVYMGSNLFTEEAGEVLGKIFGPNGSIKDLDLSHNRIRAEGSAAFFKQMAKNTFVERLDFSWNSIGLEGGKMLANLLKTNASLVYVNLQGTRINGAVMEMMIAGMAKNTTLERLTLSNNPLLISDVTSLLTALYQNPTTAIKRIDLGDNFAVTETEIPLLDVLFWEKNIDVRYGCELKFSKKISQTEDVVKRFRQDPLALVTRLSPEDRLKLVKHFARMDFEQTLETGEDIPVESFLHRVRHNKVTFKDLAMRIRKEGSNPLDTIQVTLELADVIESDTPRSTRFSVTSSVARRMSLKARQ